VSALYRVRDTIDRRKCSVITERKRRSKGSVNIPLKYSQTSGRIQDNSPDSGPPTVPNVNRHGPEGCVEPIGSHPHTRYDGSNKSHPILKQPPSRANKLMRTGYTRVYRPERNLLNRLENTYSQNFSKQEYDANRYYYYVVLPKLHSLLWHEFDRNRIRSLAYSLEMQLNCSLFRIGRDKKVNKLSFLSYRTPTVYNGPAKL
jgi:hypothetical protein